jgi:hypothetical protein
MSRAEARRALGVVLAQQPDVVALQEWYAVRRDLLPRDGWTWRAPLLGGCVVGVRRGPLTVLQRRTAWLSRPGRADRGENRVGLEPGRAATVVRCRHEESGRRLTVVGYHMVSGVQSRDAYREDRPRLVARHRGEVATLAGIVERLVAEGEEVVALGDSNLHGFALPGLSTTWTGWTGPGTLGPRRLVDDVLTTGVGERVRLVETGSDHRAVVVDLRL